MRIITFYISSCLRNIFTEDNDVYKNIKTSYSFYQITINITSTS